MCCLGNGSGTSAALRQPRVGVAYWARCFRPLLAGPNERAGLRPLPPPLWRLPQPPHRAQSGRELLAGRERETSLRGACALWDGPRTRSGPSLGRGSGWPGRRVGTVGPRPLSAFGFDASAEEPPQLYTRRLERVVVLLASLRTKLAVLWVQSPFPEG